MNRPKLQRSGNILKELKIKKNVKCQLCKVNLFYTGVLPFTFVWWIGSLQVSWSVTVSLHTTFHCSIGYFCILSDIAVLFLKKYFSLIVHSGFPERQLILSEKKFIFVEASTPPALNIVIITIWLLRIDVLCSCKHFTRADFQSSMFLRNVCPSHQAAKLLY